jgi:hypothetical protein
VDQGNGRYNVRYAETLSSGNFIPFFVPEDISTSKDILVLGDEGLFWGMRGALRPKSSPNPRGSKLFGPEQILRSKKPLRFFLLKNRNPEAA